MKEVIFKRKNLKTNIFYKINLNIWFE